MDRAQGLVASTEATLLQTRANRDQAERAWNRARQLTQLGPNLITPGIGRAGADRVRGGPGELSRRCRRSSSSRGPSLQEARDNLAKTRLISPISGRVVRLAVEEGEVAVPGTFSQGDRPAHDRSPTSR